MLHIPVQISMAAVLGWEGMSKQEKVQHALWFGSYEGQGGEMNTFACCVPPIPTGSIPLASCAPHCTVCEGGTLT